ncbi:TetR/AcrR family transcriptional regulator [Isoptericola halotolerans]|uniref:AcrR family transcriptional regulator n=1 Tax=Isoptericola halotolerans TaxID=300560 RepID=A0ABX2A9T9_9MICO|nr:TetR/AcrR family transcriptional regulator [Isoptericola halotolerans]NOV98885.1 AcrR family transcriptional regulator [Isoptericola halotolerans]
MTPAPMTRAERQQRTRDELVAAARAVFARDGYHGARLDEIAREAGYSKGAVYSNFAGKAELFLAVVDANLALAAHDPWDPFDAALSPGPGDDGDAAGCCIENVHAPLDPEIETETDSIMRGSALATLEFIATAARDPELAQQMATRMQRMVDLYADNTAPTDDDELDDRDRALLLVALDQGAALLELGGVTQLDQRLLRVGLRRILDPRRAAEHPVTDARGGSAVHLQEYRDAVRAALRGQDG